ncbi:MAG TPA: hypothetical protein VFI31_20885 [Pirellulales bacterium]|nr:hypothetical protein [Pirellulales bacterium]
MSRRQLVGVWQIIIVALAAVPALGDEPPTLVKVRLKGGRAIVGELIEQSPERLKLRDLKSGTDVAYS